MSAARWIAIVAGALLVLAAWVSLGTNRERIPPPCAPSPAERAGGKTDAAAHEVEEVSLAPALRQSALLREPELELRGVVVTSTGEAVAGAKLTVLVPMLRQVPGLTEPNEGVERTLEQGRSEGDGSFRFRLEPDRAYDLVAEAKGFAHTRIPNLYAGEEIRVVLSRSATIFGRITDAVDGSPLAEVEVETAPGPAQVPGAARSRATTDRHGTYRLEALAPGILDLKVDARDHVRVWDRLVAVEEGEERRVDFSLARGATIRGRVTDGETKAPISGASVVLRGESARRAAVTDAKGRYVLRGVPVTIQDRLFVSLRFRAPGYGEFEYGIPSVPEGEIEQDVFLLPGRRARGRVVGRDGRPVPDAWVVANGSRMEHGTWQGDRRRARTDAAGRFELLDLRIDLRHTLLAHAVGHATAVLDFPAEEWERREIDLGEILLERSGTIAGRLRDAENRALEDFWVFLDGEPRRRNSLGPSPSENEGYWASGGLGFGDLIARTDSRGRYAFTDLPAGKYRLTGRGTGCARLAHLAIDLEEGGRCVGADLVLDRGLSIEGVVFDKGGTPLTGASVQASREDDRGPAASVVSSSRGTFTLTGLDPGNHVVTVSGHFRQIHGPDGKPRHFAEARVAEVAAGSTDLRLVLPEAVPISGAVVGPEGIPVPFAWVSFRAEGQEALAYGPSADRAGRFLLWAEEGTRGTLVVRPPSWPVLNTEGQPDASYVATLENVSAGTKDLLVRLPKLP